MTLVTDANLVIAFKNGDKHAYSHLVERHWRRIFSICYGVLGNVSDGEDIAQETIMRGFEKIDSLKRPDSFGYWLSQIARNLSRDQLRKAERKNRQLDDNYEVIQETTSQNNGDLQNAISMLPEKYRQPLMLYYFNGENSHEVAKLLDLSPDGVRTRLRRARLMLHQLLSEGGNNDK